MKKTKIVATMSDFRCTEEFVKQLFDAGMDVVRVNSAHVSEDGATHIVETVHRVNPAIPIMIDTKGPEIRVTTIADEYGNSINFRPGARVAVRASTNLPIKYVVLDTKTGRTGRYLAAFRGRKTVMAVCYQLHAQRILALSYGVVPILRNQELSDRYHFLVDALEFLDQYRKLDDGDLMAIVGGSFGPDGGASYVEIANVQNIRKRNEEIVAQHNC